MRKQLSDSHCRGCSVGQLVAEMEAAKAFSRALAIDLVLSFLHSHSARMGVRIFDGTVKQCLKKMKPDKAPPGLRERATEAFQELGRLEECAPTAPTPLEARLR